MTETIIQVTLQNSSGELFLPNKYKDDITRTGCEVISGLKIKFNHLQAVQHCTAYLLYKVSFFNQ